MKDRPSTTDSSAFDLGNDHQDELFDVLSHPHRRFTLKYLQTAAAPLGVAELATQLRSWEDGQGVGPRSDADRDSIQVSLVHSHLPKMHDAGFVNYDAPGQTVTLADHTDEVESQLRAMTIS